MRSRLALLLLLSFSPTFFFYTTRGSLKLTSLPRNPYNMADKMDRGLDEIIAETVSHCTWVLPSTAVPASRCAVGNN
jgi:hypothetical protein